MYLKESITKTHRYYSELIGLLFWWGGPESEYVTDASVNANEQEELRTEKAAGESLGSPTYYRNTCSPFLKEYKHWAEMARCLRQILF